MKTVKTAGLRSIVILGLDNPAFGDGSPRTREAIAAFAEFAAAAAARYGPDQLAWEIWNEPDLDRFWTPRADPAAYARLALATCTAIKAKAPGAVVIGPASAALPDPTRPKTLALHQALRDAGAWACLDAASAHFYDLGLARSAPSPVQVAPHALAASQFVRRALGGRPLICTEWGYSERAPGGPRADNALKMVLLNRANGVPLTVLYQWRDHGRKALDPEDHFGLVDVDGQDKGGVDRLHQFMDLAGSATHVERLAPRDGDDVLLLLRFPDGNNALAAWTEAPGPARDLQIEGRKTLSLNKAPRFIALGRRVPRMSVRVGWNDIFRSDAQ